MRVGEITRNPIVAVSILLSVVIGGPLAVEHVGKTLDLWKFPFTKWTKELFFGKQVKTQTKNLKDVDWAREISRFKEFAKWAGDCKEVSIALPQSIDIRLETIDENPAQKPVLSWRLTMVSGNADLTEAQVRKKLSLTCDPEDKVSCRFVSVSRVEGEVPQFDITVDEVSGTGRITLIYDDLTPSCYEVNMRRRWRPTVVSCSVDALGELPPKTKLRDSGEWYAEGAVVPPVDDLCGYRILSISERCVWFEAFYEDEASEELLPRGSGIWPDFSRVDRSVTPGRLVLGEQYYQLGDILESGDFGLKIDEFMGGDTVVFRLLDLRDGMRSVRELLCVIVREE